MRPRSALWTTLAMTSLVLGSCGYGLVGRTSSLPPEIQNIYIEPLENRTLRSQVEQVLSRAIADEFLRRPRLTVVNSPLEAHAVLSGVVTTFSVRPVLFGATEGRATEYEILIGASMEFKRVDTEEVLWSQPFYQFRENYEFEEAEGAFFDRENLAIDEVALKFAQTLVIDVLEGF